MSRNSQQKKTSTSQLRIIGGQWRGRKLPILKAEGLRPTGDRLRETLFNWLMPDLPDSNCLDLFAGTGALGFEALSRGAVSATLVECHGPAARQLKINSATLGTSRARIVEGDAATWLATAASNEVSPFDVVFVDPPFAANLWQSTITALENSGCLAKSARIYVESPADLQIQVPTNWQRNKQKVAGAACAHLFTRAHKTAGL